MKLNGWTLPSELDDALKEHEVKENYSSFNLICELLGEYLYDKGYYRIKVEDNLTFETQQKQENNGFKKVKQGKKIRVYYQDLDFSSHDPNVVEEIVNRLSKLPLMELYNLSVNNFDESIHQYKRILYPKLGIEVPNKKLWGTFIYCRDGRYEIKKDIVINGKRTSVRFGSYDTKKNAEKVRDFLVSVNWDIKYSTKEVGLSGEKYREFIFNKINEK